VAALANADAPVSDVYRNCYHAALKLGITMSWAPMRPHASTTSTLPCCDHCWALTQQHPMVSATMWPSLLRLCHAEQLPPPPPVYTWTLDLTSSCPVQVSSTDLREGLERDTVLMAHEALSRSDAAMVSSWLSIKQGFVRSVKHYAVAHREAHWHWCG
jgi:hypothetical protein